MKFDSFAQLVQSGSTLSSFYVALEGHLFKIDSEDEEYSDNMDSTESVPGLSAFNIMGINEYVRGHNTWEEDWWAEGNSIVLKFDFKKVENVIDAQKLITK